MQPRHRVSRAAIELIKTFEGYRRKAARLADGRWTIGYGHTLSAREGAEVSEADAEALLTYDLIAVAHDVNAQTYAPLTQNQFDALVAFAFNIGIDAFRSSTVLRRINEGQLLQAAQAMELWRRADFQGERIVIDALVRRRAAEKTLFLTPVDGWVPAPSAVLKPDSDLEMLGAGLRETPAAVTTPLDGALAVAERDPGPHAHETVPTATERAAEAVSERLQRIFPEDEPPRAHPAPATPPAGTPPTTPPATPPLPILATALEKPPRPANDTPANDAAKGERPPLPPPAWPTSLGNHERPLALTPPVGQDLEPAISPRMRDADADERAVFDAKRFDAAMAGARLEPILEPGPATQVATPAPAPLDWPPLAGLGGLGLVLFVGGLAWSGGARESAGAFNPWVVGTLACLAGVGFMGLAAYLILVKLGRIEPLGRGERD